MTKRNQIFTILTGISGGLLVTVVTMRFGVSPKTASMLGGAIAAGIAAVAITRGRTQ